MFGEKDDGCGDVESGTANATTRTNAGHAVKDSEFIVIGSAFMLCKHIRSEACYGAGDDACASLWRNKDNDQGK